MVSYATPAYEIRSIAANQPMLHVKSLISEVESAMSKASVMQRAAIARELTALFSKDAASYSSEAIRLFDSIFAVVAQSIDQKALLELRERLSKTNVTLSEFARQLAMVDEIEIAGPVLEHSDALTDDDLVEVIKTRGREYLLAVANRKKLSAAITDALIERGVPDITRKIVADPEMPISHVGFVRLLGEAKADSKIAEAISSRPDLPSELQPFLKLLRKKSA